MTDLAERRSRLKHKMSEARQALITTLRSLTPEQMAMPSRNEGWSVGDLAIHISGGEAGMEVLAKAILSRDPDHKENVAKLDLNRYNDSMIQRGKEKTIADLVATLEASRIRVFEIIDNISEADFDLPGHHPLVGDVTLYGLFVVMYKHERIHNQDIKDALAGITV